MKVLENTLTLEWKAWHDPGGCPNGAGAGPLSSYDYPVCEGSVMVLLTEEEFGEGLSAGEIAVRLGQEGTRLEPGEVEALDAWEQEEYVATAEGGWRIEIYPTKCSVGECYPY